MLTNQLWKLEKIPSCSKRGMGHLQDLRHTYVHPKVHLYLQEQDYMPLTNVGA